MTSILDIIRRKGLVEIFFCGLGICMKTIFSKMKISCLRARGYDIDFSVGLGGRNLLFQSTKNAIKIEKGSEIGFGVKLTSGFGGQITINKNVGIFDYSIIDIHTKLVIGENTLIAPFCYITDYDHIIKDKNKPIVEQGYTSKPIIIGKNVWLGAKVIILKGVTIGDNTIIGAGSVVTKDIPPNCVVVGNPARVVKRLFKT